MKTCSRGILNGWDLMEDREKVFESGGSWVTDRVRSEQHMKARGWWELCDGASKK
jgi:hypothetical protein